jgi:hypothetical protein
MTDFIASGCVGLAQVSIGHPFDTTLTLIQNKRKWMGLPFRSYYRGWRYPLCSAVLFNMTVFPIVERSHKYTNSSLISGALAGACAAPIMFCFELGKIRQQTCQPMTVRKLFENKGRISILTRELIAMSSYFGSYNYLRSKELNPLVAGGAAGLMNWTLTYPVEVVKNRQMAQNISIAAAVAQKGLWKGYSICAIRAVLVNAVNFWTYETVKNLLS